MIYFRWDESGGVLEVWKPALRSPSLIDQVSRKAISCALLHQHIYIIYSTWVALSSMQNMLVAYLLIYARASVAQRGLGILLPGAQNVVDVSHSVSELRLLALPEVGSW